jgi:hypothetical protein
MEENSRFENNSENDFYETYDGNQILSFQGVFLWVGVPFFEYVLIRSDNYPFVFPICFFIFFYIFLSFQMSYFQVSENHLRILKHNLFWEKKVYKLFDIQEIVFEKLLKSGCSLRVITTDYRSKFYVAGTLNDKAWLDLKSKLESYNILVTDKRPQELPPT